MTGTQKENESLFFNISLNAVGAKIGQKMT